VTPNEIATRLRAAVDADEKDAADFGVGGPVLDAAFARCRLLADAVELMARLRLSTDKFYGPAGRVAIDELLGHVAATLGGEP
jgi:hypothetical protein